GPAVARARTQRGLAHRLLPRELLAARPGEKGVRPPGRDGIRPLSRGHRPENLTLSAKYHRIEKSPAICLFQRLFIYSSSGRFFTRFLSIFPISSWLTEEVTPNRKQGVYMSYVLSSRGTAVAAMLVAALS